MWCTGERLHMFVCGCSVDRCRFNLIHLFSINSTHFIVIMCQLCFQPSVQLCFCINDPIWQLGIASQEEFSGQFSLLHFSVETKIGDLTCARSTMIYAATNAIVAIVFSYAKAWVHKMYVLWWSRNTMRRYFCTVDVTFVVLTTTTIIWRLLWHDIARIQWSTCSQRNYLAHRHRKRHVFSPRKRERNRERFPHLLPHIVVVCASSQGSWPWNG